MNGQQLVSKWDGIDAAGSGYLNSIFLSGTYVSWDITCLFDTIPANGANSHGEDVVQVATFLIHSPPEGVPLGFTVSYKQLDHPEIVGLSLTAINLAGVKANPEEWRTRSQDPGSMKTVTEVKEVTDEFPSFARHGQKSLQDHLQAIGHFMEEKAKAVESSFKGMVETCRKHLRAACPNKALSKSRLSTFLSENHAIESRPNLVSSDHLLEAPHQNETRSATTSESLESTFSGLPSPSPSFSSSPSLSFPITTYHDRVQSLKILGLVLILGSLFAWVILHLRDPRVRADRAARREERQNRLLYRRAAWRQKWKRWFCSVRHNHGQAIGPIGSWDEKRSRVIQQEEILEAVMKEDIRALRKSHRVVSNISAAEEGRAEFVYESDGSEARRSRDTLPGYESDATQPPGYETDGVSCEGPNVSNGFRYVPAESEDTPDSSVVSTSPRISRDGRDSDYEKDFEPLALDSRGTFSNGLVR